ncbi:MAG: methyltransferase regulatory domain-containing protein [Rhizobiaceae bacterium]
MQHVANVMKLNPWYLRANPDVAEFLDQHLSTSPEVFAHEYLNENWQPMSFHEVASSMENIGLSFATQSSFNEYQASIHLDERQCEFIDKIKDIKLRETSADFMRMRSNRCDYWIKEPQYLSQQQRRRQIKEILLSTTKPIADFKSVIDGDIGEFSVDPQSFHSLLSTIASSNYTSIGALLAIEPEFEKLMGKLAVLIFQDLVTPVREDKPPNTSGEAHHQAFNSTVLGNAKFHDINHLASNSHGGIKLSQVRKYFLKQWNEGARNPATLAENAKKFDPQFKDTSQGKLITEANTFLEFYPDFISRHDLI